MRIIKIDSINFDGNKKRDSKTHSNIKKQLVDYLSQGKSMTEIAVLMNKSETTIYRYLYEYNLRTPKQIKMGFSNQHDESLNNKFLEFVDKLSSDASISADITNNCLVKTLKFKTLPKVKQYINVNNVGQESNLSVLSNDKENKEYSNSQTIRKMKKPTVEMIAEDLKNHLTHTEIAYKYNISVSTVNNMKKRINKEEIVNYINDKILLLTGQGYSNKLIAQKLKITYMTLCNYIKKRNLVNQIENMKMIRKSMIYSDYLSGMKVVDIAKKYNHSQRKIYDIINAFKKNKF